ncbi:MAG: pilus assembly protein PilM [Planctomycetes bacterium]|nr:pilus assembly protein PilM [Planctomycetota bacterium]
MVGWILKPRYGPLGVDIGSDAIKLVQFNADRSRVLEAAHWKLTTAGDATQEERDAQIVQALGRLRRERRFRGRHAVFCLGAGDLFVQNIRVPPADSQMLPGIVRSEAAGRIPFDVDEAEIRFLDAADVRQGDVLRREVVLLACRRRAIERLLSIARETGLIPLALDVEPAALLRCYARQFRRDEDQRQRIALINLGASATSVTIAEGAEARFVKYVDFSGRQLDRAVAERLRMPSPEAASLRRHNGDRRADQRDPEITRSIVEAVRPLADRLAHELSMCIRYFSVTFRGDPVAKLVFGGGEASPSMIELLANRLDMPCELGNPMRSFDNQTLPGQAGQWDVAAGLALRNFN